MLVFSFLPSVDPDKPALRAASVIVSLRWPFRFEGGVMGIPYKFVGKVRQEIADAYASGEMLKSISARYGCDKATVCHIARSAGLPKRMGIKKQIRIIELSQAHPELSPRQIARIVGANPDYVWSVRKMCGFRYQRRASKAILIVRLSGENPHLGCERIARLAGVSIAYAKEVRRKHGIRAQNHRFASVSAATLNQGGVQGLST
jgi:hypothetical protein